MHGPSMPPHSPSPLVTTAAAPSHRRRGPEFSLAAELRSPAFTPRRGDAPELLALFLRGELTESATAQGLLRIGPSAFASLVTQLQSAKVRGTVRAALVRLLGRLTRPESPHELQTLLALLQDADPPARRNAIASLGRLPLTADHAASPLVEAALLAQWRAHPRPGPEDRRALAEALGKCGGQAALAALREVLGDDAAEPLLRPIAARAVLRLERTLLRPANPANLSPEDATHTSPGALTIDATAALPQPTAVTLLCRAGLTPLLVEELRERGLVPAQAPLKIEESLQIGEPGRVTLRTTRPLAELLAARTCTELALPLTASRSPLRGRAAANAKLPGELVERVAGALTDPRTVQLLRALGRAPLRYRIHFTAMGHRRALVWQIATAVSGRCPELRNDPRDSPWELRIGGELPASAAPSAPAALASVAAEQRLELVPRQLPDPRFAYRRGDVPAASHPTLAAALARLTAARPDDVVWDPFVGSGSELIEVALRSRQGSGAAPVRLCGSDLSAAALATAADNAAAAGVELSLSLGDALGPPPPGLTRIITNPPMGRRVRRGDAAELLHRFAAHAARCLPRGGQLTWIAPQPQLTGPILQAGGLKCVREHRIDMNGFWARLEVWVKA